MRPQRSYDPATGHGEQHAGSPDARDHALADLAGQTGATLHIYPRPRHALRRIVLREARDDRGTRYLDAAIEANGTLRSLATTRAFASANSSVRPSPRTNGCT
jgi:hypothetical protein